MSEQSIGLGVAGQARELQTLRHGAARPRDATEGVDDKTLALNEPSVEKWSKSQSRGRRVTTGHRDEPRAGEFLAMSLDQPVDGVAQKIAGDEWSFPYQVE